MAITFSGEKTREKREKREKTKLIRLLEKRRITSVNCVFSVYWVGSQPGKNRGKIGKIEQKRRENWSKKMGKSGKDEKIAA